MRWQEILMLFHFMRIQSIRRWPHDSQETNVYLKNRNSCSTPVGPVLLYLESHCLKTFPNLIVLTFNPSSYNRIEFLLRFFLNISQFSSD